MTKLDELINKINPYLFRFELSISCSDIDLDPKDTVLIHAITKAYKPGGWTVKLNSRDNTLNFT